MSREEHAKFDRKTMRQHSGWVNVAKAAEERKAPKAEEPARTAPRRPRASEQDES